MALSAFSTTVRTTTTAWADLVLGARIVTAIMVANTSNDDVVVQVRLVKSGSTAVIVPRAVVADGDSARVRLPSLPLAGGEKIQVASSGACDWIAIGMQ